MIKNVSEEKYLKCVKEAEDFFDSSLFKVLSEPVRWNIMKFLTLHGENDIGTIAENFEQDRSCISRHLSQMYDLGILKRKKISRYVVYELDGPEILNKFEEITDKLKKMLCTESKGKSV